MIRVVAQLSWTTSQGWSTSRGVPKFWIDASLDTAEHVIREIIMRPHDATSYTISAGLWDEDTETYKSMKFTHNIPA